MAVQDAAWINVRTGKFEWIDEHARWIKNEMNAEKLGIPKDVWAEIAKIPNDYSGPLREKILLKVMNAGFVRARKYASYISLEFTAPSVEALWSAYEFLHALCGPYTQVRFTNLRTGERIELSYKQYAQRMQEDPETILRVAKKLRVDDRVKVGLANAPYTGQPFAGERRVRIEQ